MTAQRTPQTIANHLRTATNPALTAIAHMLPADTLRQSQRTVTGCAATLDGIDLTACAISLGQQRAVAAAGRPRGESTGSGSGISDPTLTIATEVDRLRMVGYRLQQAIDALHPDPAWPTIASGWRASTSTATEHLARTIDALAHHEDGDLDDAIGNLSICVREVVQRARQALAARAWPPPRQAYIDIDPPDAILIAARCTSWPLGLDKNGNRVWCGNYRGKFGHVHPDTGTAHHNDTCDDCYRLICPQCWTRVRRSPGARECMACEVKNRRGRAA